jgi:hypothetical protein
VLVISAPYRGCAMPEPIVRATQKGARMYGILALLDQLAHLLARTCMPTGRPAAAAQTAVPPRWSGRPCAAPGLARAQLKRLRPPTPPLPWGCGAELLFVLTDIICDMNSKKLVILSRDRPVFFGHLHYMHRPPPLVLYYPRDLSMVPNAR